MDIKLVNLNFDIYSVIDFIINNIIFILLHL